MADNNRAIPYSASHEDMIPVELGPDHTQSESGIRANSTYNYLDDSTSKLLPPKERPYSPAPSFRAPRIVRTHDNFKIAPSSMGPRGRFWRLCVFIVIEFTWLGFALLSNFQVIETPTGDKETNLPFGIRVSSDTAFKSALSILGIVVQLAALTPVADITMEIYSGEWTHILSCEGEQLTLTTDRVSTLTSSYTDRLRHSVDKRASWQYRASFIVALLAMVLQSISPGALTVSTDYARQPFWKPITPFLPPGSTDPTAPILQNSSGSPSSQTALERDLILQNTRNLYNLAVVGDFGLSSAKLKSDSNYTFIPPVGPFASTVPSVLLGVQVLNSMPTQLINYKSDGVSFRFECQWLAPTYSGGSLVDANWTFGGDMVGRLDYNAMPIGANIEWLYGIWPLMITSGEGGRNGSIALLYIGGEQGNLSSNSTRIPVDLSGIPPHNRTFNSTGWYDLVKNPDAQKPGSEDIFAFFSTDASVLFCDSHMEMVTVEAIAQTTGQQTIISASRIDYDGGTVGNLDWDETSRLLGRSLNGVPWDTVQSNVTGLNLSSGISQLSVDMYLLTPNNGLNYLSVDLSMPNQIPLAPYSIQGENLGLYILQALTSTYQHVPSTFDVTAQSYYEIERLSCNWPQWGGSVAVFVIISLLLGALSRKESGGRRAVPLTIATVIQALEHEADPHTRAIFDGENIELT